MVLDVTPFLCILVSKNLEPAALVNPLDSGNKCLLTPLSVLPTPITWFLNVGLV